MINSPTPTPERKCPDNRGNELCTNGKDTYHEYNMRNAGCTFCGAKVSPTPESRLRELEEEAVDLMNDRRTGLRDSSDTNKTRYTILGLIEDAYKLGLSQERELLVGEVESVAIDDTRGVEHMNGEMAMKRKLVALLKSKN